MPSKLQPGEPVDWAIVRQRLKTAMDATAGLWEPSAQLRQQKIEARAKAFTRSRTAAAGSVPTIGAVHFDLAGKRYAIEARYVSEAVPLRSVTPIPRTADFVIGLYDLRGQLLPVFNLHQLLEPANSRSPLPNWAIVCGLARPEFLLATSAMASIATDFPEPVSTQSGVAAGWTYGTTADGTTILDGGALLADRQLFVNEPTAGGGPEDANQ